MEFIAIFSVFSNLLFIYMYNQKIWKNKFSLFTFTVFEHFVLAFIFLLRFFMPTTSSWVKTYKLRKVFKEEQLRIKNQ